MSQAGDTAFRALDLFFGLARPHPAGEEAAKDGSRSAMVHRFIAYNRPSVVRAWR
jgi:hypothetical protein